MFRRLLSYILLSSTLLAAEPKLLLEDPFTQLSPEWFWGLGTWTAKDGVLRAFESGERRHGRLWLSFGNRRVDGLPRRGPRSSRNIFAASRAIRHKYASKKKRQRPSHNARGSNANGTHNKVLVGFK